MLVSHTGTAGSDCTYIWYTNELPVSEFGTGNESGFGRIRHFDLSDRYTGPSYPDPGQIRFKVFQVLHIYT
jgi:hypothetical protein